MIQVNSAGAPDRTKFQAGMCVPLPGNQSNRAAQAKYKRTRCPSWINWLRSTLVGRPPHLLRLADVQASCTVRSSHYAGTRPVPIRQIQGSEGCCEDFDNKFRPLRLHNKGRWVRVAEARLREVTLPPVELIQVGDVYFVRDGHHRISVAKAFGQKDIDAEITVWEVTSPLPQERPTPVSRLAAQPA